MKSVQQAPPIFSLEIPDAEFVVCDVETTGLSPTRNRLTEIALVKIANGEIVDRFQTLINPQQFIPPEISEYTGITNEMVYDAPKSNEVMPKVQNFIGQSIFVAHNVQFDRNFIDASLQRVGSQPLESPNLCTCRLSRRIYPKLKSKSLGSVAAHIGIRIKHRHRALGDADATAKLLLHFFGILSEEFDITCIADLLSFQNKPVYRVSSPPRNVANLKEAISQLPHEPGVYLFYNKRGEIIYVGKAKNLKDRVSSYFYHNVGHTRKVEELVRQVHHLSYERTETELSALLLESHNIKKHQPRFNSMLKHDRRFPFIRLDVSELYPTISWCYDVDEDGAEYFGPFSGRYTVESALDTINHLFLLRECDGELKPNKRSSPCLYYDIKRCAAPCSDTQSKQEYDEEVTRVKQFLQGHHDEVLSGLYAQMDSYSNELRFEDAGAIRDRLQSLRKIIRQQETMMSPIHIQNMIIITPARRTFVEVHFIKEGQLAKKFFIDQKSIDRKLLRKEIQITYFTEQKELFEPTPTNVNEMRIIATWCLAHKNESCFISVGESDSEKIILQKLIREIASAGQIKELEITQVQQTA